MKKAVLPQGEAHNDHTRIDQPLSEGNQFLNETVENSFDPSSATPCNTQLESIHEKPENVNSPFSITGKLNSGKDNYPRHNVSRRTLFKVAGVAAVSFMSGGMLTHPAHADSLNIPVYATDAVNIDVASSAKFEALMSKQVESMGGLDVFGQPISSVYQNSEGVFKAYQRVVLKFNPINNSYELLNTLDLMNQLGLDTNLDNGSLGVTIPPMESFNDGSNGDLNKADQTRIAHFNVPQTVVDYRNQFTKKGVNFGAFTGYKDYGAYKVWRAQRGSFQLWPNGSIQLILAGDAYKKAGLVPYSALLIKDVKADEFATLKDTMGTLETVDYNALLYGPADPSLPTFSDQARIDNPATRGFLPNGTGRDVQPQPNGTTSVNGIWENVRVDGTKYIMTVAADPYDPNKTIDISFDFSNPAMMFAFYGFKDGATNRLCMANTLAQLVSATATYINNTARGTKKFVPIGINMSFDTSKFGSIVI